jgi:16S rRNA (cytosine1407-C5)-methyltransferase
MKLPALFVESIKKMLGEQADALFKALEQVPPVAIRMNPYKVREHVQLGVAGSVPWSTDGFYLHERPTFTFDPLLHAGCYYVQEASSMFVEQAFQTVLTKLNKLDLRVLDLCAAPGGKSTLLAALLPSQGLLIANELIRTRANILVENLIKWGLPNVVVTQSDSSAIGKLTECFDAVLADVPCSGEGMFRKDPESMQEWSPDNVVLCAKRQKDIVQNIWPALKTGGYLIYSTCTYNLAENEENVRWLCETLGGTLCPIKCADEWGISGAQGDFANREDFPVYRFFPHKTVGEGFFLALIRKEILEPGSPNSVRISKKKTFSEKMPSLIQNWLLDEHLYDFKINRVGQVMAFPKQHIDLLARLEILLKINHAGVVLGEIKGKDMVPAASLALSTVLNMESVTTFELTLSKAIDYLRRESLVLDESCPYGWVLMCYDGCPLGWIKNIGNRANNNYPNEWRIRSGNPFTI